METLSDIITAIASVIVGAIVIIGGIDAKIGNRRWKGKKTDHFDGKHFYNLGWTKKQTLQLEQEDKKTGYVYGFLRFVLERDRPKWQRRPTIPVQVKTYNETSEFHITYIGHATLLIQIDGINIITDPVYAERASPVKFSGPRRYTDPGIAFDDLPPIDIILLSHNHYDHMDLATLRRIYARGDTPVLYTGLGNAEYLEKNHIHAAIDMDWWEEEFFEKNKKQIQITYLPAQHFSARGITDRNKTLWGGFALDIRGKTLYFAGDTGYGTFVEHIHDRFPRGFDIGLLPIGAYKPTWFLAKIHTGPTEALQMQKDLAIKTGIGIHWGVFALAGDRQDEPAHDLEKAKKEPHFRGLDFRIGPSGTEWKIPKK